MIIDEKNTDYKESIKPDIDKRKLGYEARTIYAHPRDWYVIMAYIMLVNRLRENGLRK